jgi:hypothetical protein
MPEWLITGFACATAYMIINLISSYFETKRIKKDFRLIYEEQLQEFVKIMIRDRKKITSFLEELNSRLEILENKEQENV